MLKRLLFTTLLCLTGWTGSSNAALIGVCTYSGGANPECTPDFSIGVSNVDFDYHDNGFGTLTVDGLVGNATFQDGQLQGVSGDVTRSVFGSPFISDDIFSLIVTVDTSGIVQSSSVTMNGHVQGTDFPDAAVSANGTILSGALISGATIDQIGWLSTEIDFLGSIGASSLLSIADYGSVLSGKLNLTFGGEGSNGSEVVWNSDWNTSTATLDVVVPVPAAFWLFLSGITALVSTARRRKLI